MSGSDKKTPGIQIEDLEPTADPVGGATKSTGPVVVQGCYFQGCETDPDDPNLPQGGKPTKPTGKMSF